MKRRRRCLAVGLFVALVGFGGPSTASSDSFGKKTPSPPPPRPNLSNHEQSEGGSGPLIGSTDDGSTTIIPPPPPSQQLHGIPPPRIQPPPRASQSTLPLNRNYQRRVPPPPPHRPEGSNSKDNESGSIISYASEMATKYEAESIEQVQHPQTLKSGMVPGGIESCQRGVPHPPPPRPDESDIKDNGFFNTVGNASERSTRDEAESIEQVRPRSKMIPEDIDFYQRRVPPPPPPRPDESSIKDSDVVKTVGNASERPTKDEAEPILQVRPPPKTMSTSKAEGIGLNQRRVLPPPPPRSDESNIEDNEIINAVGHASEMPTKVQAESILQQVRPLPTSMFSGKAEGIGFNQRRALPPPPPRPDQPSNDSSFIGSVPERPSEEDDVRESAEIAQQEPQKIESKATPMEMEMDQRRVPHPPPKPMKFRATHDEFRGTLDRFAKDDGSRDRVNLPLKTEFNAKQQGTDDIELKSMSKTSKNEEEEYTKAAPHEGVTMTSDMSTELTREPESKEAKSSEPISPEEDVTSSIESSKSDLQMKTLQTNEESHHMKDSQILAQLPSPLIKFGPDSNTQPAFIRSQRVVQGLARQLERADSRPHSQQGTFTMPLTHDHPMQPNRFQQQNQQGYGQAPNPQNRYPGRPPQTNVRRPSPPTSSGASSSPSFFKNIIGSVEKGLDELSNVEEKIAKRAQKLVSSAASSSGISNVVDFATRGLSSRSSRSTHTSSKRTTKQPSKTPPSSPNKSPFTHLGKKYESAKSGNASSSQPAVTQKLILANGGASAPGGQTPNQPIPPIPLPVKGATTPAQPEQREQPQQQQQQQQRQSQQQQQQFSQQLSQGSGHGSFSATQSPFGASPYKPATDTRKMSDPHSRESRIPWETSKAGTSRPNQTQMPVMKSFEDDISWKEKLIGALPRLPRLPNPAKLFRFRKSKGYQYANMDAWKDDDDDSRRGLFGLFKKKSSSDFTSHRTTQQTRPSKGISEPTKTPIDSLMERSSGGKTTSLLASSDEAKCRSLGRYHATFDFVQVMFLILGVQQLSGLERLTIPTSLSSLMSTTIPIVGEIIRASITTWAPFWFAYALLTKVSTKVMLESKVEYLASEVGDSVEEDSVYGQLYLRLIAATPIDTRLVSRLSEAAQSEVKWMVAKARLSSFATFMAGLLFFMTATVLRPAMMVIGKGALDFVTLQDFRSWPIEWKSLWNHLSAIWMTSFQKLETLIVNFLMKAMDKPLNFTYHLSIFAALFLATMIPKIESKAPVPTIDFEEEEMEIENEGLDQISRLGASSATRLTMLSENGSVENVLERWRASNVPSAVLQSTVRLSQILRQMCYVVLAGLTSFAPLLIPFLFEQASPSPGLHTGLQWDSMLDVSVILISVFMLVWNALKQSTLLQASLPYAKSFLSDLSKTMEEIAESNKQQADLKLSASISANAGLVVRDLWAAHTTKHAWAVRGANLECRNGEVLAVLGDDSSGKSRLLTTIAESLITPPKQSRTSNTVRGFVAVGGLDGSKWDKASLKRRLGILLSDVCTLGDTASIFSGWTLEEILEPVDGVQPYPRTLTSSEKSAVRLGLKITGLYDTLIRRLPSKMNTVITGNEEDLGKTSVDPTTTVLSPAEWSKLLLAKVIAQTISDNDNVMASTDKIENSLMGSVLILDDVAVLLSEVEEAKVIRELRQTGAATVISSNKWATGRFADRIAVVNGGAIVEVGSHNELIARGPQRSLYAAKWHAMTIG